MADVAAAAASLAPEEQRELQAQADFLDHQSRISGGTAPERQIVSVHLPVSGSVLVDHAGRVWIERNVAAVKVAPYSVPGVPSLTSSYVRPTVWSSFRVDGTYLGDIRFPPSSRVFGFLGDVAWAIVRDTADQQYLVKYRIRGGGQH